MCLLLIPWEVLMQHLKLRFRLSSQELVLQLHTNTHPHTFFLQPSIGELVQQMLANYSAAPLFFVRSATLHPRQQAASAHWLWILTS